MADPISVNSGLLTLVAFIEGQYIPVPDDHDFRNAQGQVLNMIT
jgi:hypothetical protein